MENYSKYYRVFINDTKVIELSTNNFLYFDTRPYKIIWTDHHPIKVYCSVANQSFRLHSSIGKYHDYTDKIMAMEKAKEGALRYISSLIKQAQGIISTLKQYRNDHYEDLNKNLIDSQIRKLELASTNR
ncbi:hypothetical protein H8S90_09075 [Olivibacter sp. SDN3]|uniref:hypothetical protein n=1 Tax=Olivibacter sp. SDN3 TaxID=2764720 RepID=UPI001651842E|nr:hypothetical protein [Olivibacter sp. SDN3]QNL51703.1 hypothetical protein H8S90_09075 [Olivibacter sp. SDN3]